MPCLLNKDQPLRVKLSKNGVTHAGDYFTTRAYTQYSAANRDGEKIPSREVVRIACSWKNVGKSKVVSNKEPITCKNCMKAMGMVDGPVFPDRFVIQNTETGEFFKNTRSRCSVWSADVTDAWFYKRKGDAKRQTQTTKYKLDDGRLVTYSELRQIHGGTILYADARKRSVRVDKPGYKIRKVKITLED